MIGPFGFDWENKVRSLKVGPTANLTIFDNRDFRDQDVSVPPEPLVDETLLNGGEDRQQGEADEVGEEREDHQEF